MAIFAILYSNYYPPHEEFEVISIGKFARRTWVNFIEQYGKHRQRCQQNKFHCAVWQLLLYYYREFPSKIFSVYYVKKCTEKNLNKLEQSSDFWISNLRKYFTFITVKSSTCNYNLCAYTPISVLYSTNLLMRMDFGTTWCVYA